MLLPSLQKENFSPGDVVVREGSALDRIFFVLSGRVRQEKILGITLEATGLEAWQEKELFEEITAGNHFGAGGLVEPAPSLVDWVAVEQSQLLSLSFPRFRQILQQSDTLGRKLLESLCRTLHESGRRYEESFAMQVENKKLMLQMGIERKKIKAMHRIAGSTAASDVKQTLDTILDACIDCLRVEKGSIMIFDRGVLRVEAAFGANREKILGQQQIITENSVSGRCFMTKKPVFIQDIEREQNLDRSPDPSQYWNNSLISMPLLSAAGESIGVLNVSKTSHDVFTEDDMKILDDLTMEASAALGHEIELARLFRSFQETYVEVKRTQKQLQQVEDKVCRIIDTSWPAIGDRMGGVADE